MSELASHNNLYAFKAIVVSVVFVGLLLIYIIIEFETVTLD